MSIAVLLGLGLGVVSACGDSSTNLVDGDGGAGGDGGGLGDGGIAADADPFAPDAGPWGCVIGATQCNNCIDDDSDGLIDGFDAECTGILDNDEGSFATGISGDNIDTKTQDCFFDGNSGGGDDKCAYHTCCVLDLTAQPDGVCPADLQPPSYVAEECTTTATCAANCAPLTPPGCDCFGCCTVCDDDSCRDIATNPAISPECDLAVLDDPAKCFACNKSTTCNGGGCDPEGCTLCPGQTVDDLPEECVAQECPGGALTCTTTADCLTGAYCSTGCCLQQIE